MMQHQITGDDDCTGSSTHGAQGLRMDSLDHKMISYVFPVLETRVWNGEKTSVIFLMQCAQ